MEDKKTIFNYVGQMFSIYGVMIMIFIVINLIIGNEAGSVSTLFSLGSSGLSTATLLELFLLVLIVTAAQNIFLTDILIKNLALIVRNILFFATILIAITAFAVVFGWFPLDNVAAWIGFIVSFTICATVSAFLMRLEENAENKKMQEALKRFNK